MKTINILVLGDKGVGKTVYINRLKTGNFEKKYIPSENGTSTLIPSNMFEGRYDSIQFFEFSDFEGWPEKVDGVVVMFDVTFSRSVKNVQKYIAQAFSRYGEVRYVVCGNKVDVRDRQVKPKDIHALKEKCGVSTYFDISARSCYNLYKPLDEVALTETVEVLRQQNPPPVF